MPPKNTADLAVLLVDVNSSANHSSLSNPIGLTDFQLSIQLVDSLLTRKAADLYSLVFFGFPPPGDGFFVSRDFKVSDFMTVQSLSEVKPVPRAIEKAVALFDNYCNDYPKIRVNKTIFLLSNLAEDDMMDAKEAVKLAKVLGKNEVDLIVGSPDSVLEDKATAQFQFMQTLVSQSTAQWCPLSECERRFSIFNPREPTPRGQPFDFQLDERVTLKLQLFVKNVDPKLGRKFVPIGLDNKEYAKHYHHVTEPELKVSLNELDEIPDEEFRTGVFSKAQQIQRDVNVENVIKGYSYGKDLVPVSELDVEDFVPKQETKQLRLIQFTSEANILPQYILSEARYLLPVSEAEGTQTVMMGLVKELLEKKMVALVRYAYNAVANPKVACLFPKLSKRGIPVFVHYLLPFGDDVRNFEFPPLVDAAEPLSEYQEDAMDEFVENMMLRPDQFRARDLPEPRIQHECLLLKAKALHPDITLPSGVDSSQALAQFRRPAPEKSVVLDSLNSLKDAFPLQIDPSVRETHFKHRELGTLPPIDFEDKKDGVKDF